MSPKAEKRLFLCGTRAVVRRVRGYRVVCATCGAGGTVPYPTLEAAEEVAVRNSANPCPGRPGCGAS